MIAKGTRIFSVVTTKLDTLPEKLDALRKKFFLPPKHADLTDIGSNDYPVPLEIDDLTTSITGS